MKFKVGDRVEILERVSDTYGIYAEEGDRGTIRDFVTRPTNVLYKVEHDRTHYMLAIAEDTLTIAIEGVS